MQLGSLSGDLLHRWGVSLSDQAKTRTRSNDADPEETQDARGTLWSDPDDIETLAEAFGLDVELIPAWPGCGELSKRATINLAQAVRGNRCLSRGSPGGRGWGFRASIHRAPASTVSNRNAGQICIARRSNEDATCHRRS